MAEERDGASLAKRKKQYSPVPQAEASAATVIELKFKMANAFPKLHSLDIGLRDILLGF